MIRRWIGGLQQPFRAHLLTRRGRPVAGVNLDDRDAQITYAELCFGAVHSTHVESNMQELDAFCADLDILPFDSAAGVHYGEIRRALTRRGRLIGINLS